MTTLKQMKPPHCGDKTCVPCAMRFLFLAAEQNLPGWVDEDTDFILTGILAAGAYGTVLNGGPRDMVNAIVENMSTSAAAASAQRALSKAAKPRASKRTN